jgi:hypothetical protein
LKLAKFPAHLEFMFGIQADIVNEEYFRVLHKLLKNVGTNESDLLATYNERAASVFLVAYKRNHIVIVRWKIASRKID